MTISELLKKSGYAIVFGFMGLIIGIWTADLLYTLGLKNMERMTTTYVSLFIIILIIAASSFLGFTRGKDLLE
ncbi:MAG: hypothetical protein O8C60_02445 [Candidatus Methanoperedens sp.]|nr:hypothetical protein [Candidatus Methanoperedens sp.]